MSTKIPRRVGIAALRTRDGVIYSLPRPARHHDVIADMHRLGVSARKINYSTQGFIDSHGSFITRVVAKRIAKKAGQLRADTPHKELFSEDVW